MQTQKSIMNLDARYTIGREWTGAAAPQWVARFCGEWIGCAPVEDGAKELAKEYERKRWED